MSTFPVEPPVTPAAPTPEAGGAAHRRELSQEEIATLPLQALLVRAGHITLDQLADALRENVATGRAVEDIALSRGWLSAEQLDALRTAKQSYAPGAPAPAVEAPAAPAPVAQATAPRPRRRPSPRARPSRRLRGRQRPPHPCRSTQAPAPPAPVVQAPPPAPAARTRPGRTGPGSGAGPRRRSTRRARLGRRSRHVGRRLPEPRGRRAHLGGPLRQPRGGRAARAEPDRVARSSGARRLAPLRRPARPPRRCRQRRSVTARRALDLTRGTRHLARASPLRGIRGYAEMAMLFRTGEAMPGTTNSAAKGLFQ